MKMWKSENPPMLECRRFQGPCGTDGSLLGKTGKWGACGWSVVQLDFDEELELLHGMYCSLGAELEVQRTIKRAQLTAFLCLLKKVVGPIKVHVDNKRITDGLRKGESKCIKPRAGDADLWIQFWEELLGLAERGILVEVERAMAHRTKKEKKNMPHFERFVTEGNEKVDGFGKSRSDAGRRIHGRSESRNYAAGKRRCV